MRSNPRHSLRLALIPLLAAALLSGCGAGGEEGVVASTDASAYRKTLSDCGIAEPTGASTAYGSLQWDTQYRWTPGYHEVNTVVSAGGAPANASTPVLLQVAIPTSGYIEPDWRMGISFVAALPERSAACVAGLVNPRANASAPLAGTGVLPLGGLPGPIIDGFQFVGTFSIPDAAVFFTRPKIHTPSVDRLSVCYLAVGASQWDCASPDKADLGTSWRVARRGARPGVYVVSAPAA